MTGEDAGDSVCDCHDLLPASLAMTGEKECLAMTKEETLHNKYSI